ncbi:MAG: glycoprotein endo-alpha-1,2-mannosidase [Polaribacter sp.]|jgi:glycoprotein endo-alpha-1,2-mannosidase
MKTKFKLLRIILLLILVTIYEKEKYIGIDNELTTQKKQLAASEVIKSNSKKVYVHYMPWFLNLEQDGFWGQHWTMTNKDLNVMDAKGKREIASHYYPLIGPYSSNDNDLQEYHLLLMKLSGIDGVIFDRYISRDVKNNNALKTNTESFTKEIEDVGLKFAMMHEDKTAKYTATEEEDSSIINNTVVDLKYIQDTYFTRKII